MTHVPLWLREGGCGRQFDILIYVEETTAITPLDSGTNLTEEGKGELAAGAGAIHLEDKE